MLISVFTLFITAAHDTLKSFHLRPRAERFHGFTLIGILAILAALLFPAIGKGVNTAKLARSQSNIRQLAQCVLLYAGDHEGVLPPAAGQSSIPGPAISNWVLALRESGYSNAIPDVLVVSGRISTYACPLALACRPYDQSVAKGTYAMNAYASPKNAPRRLSSFNTPSATALLMGSRWHPGLKTWPQTEIGGTGAIDNRWPEFPYPIRALTSDASPFSGHPDPSAIVAFVDGHVELVPKSRMPDPYASTNAFWGGL